ncbi:UNVERIFIED_CONTAM: hypothetical protein GTU68_012061 [Idotea baltica]|nr:hypothetical protein [Idotea baltica]
MERWRNYLMKSNPILSFMQPPKDFLTESKMTMKGPNY